MAAGGSRFDDRNYKNWLRATLALMYMKEGLEDFSDALSKVFHTKLLSSCGTGTLRCTSRCTFRDFIRDTRKQRWYMRCTPCDNWLTALISHHTKRPFPKLSPENTDPQKWYFDHWETSKLFMSYGCRSDTCAKDCDIQGILSLFINSQFFVASGHIGRAYLLDGLVEVRNALFHSGSFQVSDTDVNDHLHKIISFLQGMTGLTGSQSKNIKEAVGKIQELQANCLDLSLNKELELRALQQKQIGLEREMKRIENTAKSLKKEQDSQKNTVDTHGTRLSSTDTEIKEHRNSITKLLDVQVQFNKFLTLNGLDQDFKKIVNTFSEFEQSIGRLEKALKQQDKNIDQLDNETKRHEQSISQLDTLSKQHDQSIGQLDNVSKQHEQIICQFDMVSKQHEQSIGKLDTRSKQHMQSIGQLDTVSQHHEYVIVQLDKVSKQHAQSIDQLDTLTKQHSDCVCQLSTESRQHEQSISQLDTILKRHEHSIDKLDSVTTQHERATGHIDTISKQNKQNIEQLDRRTNKQERSMGLLGDRITELEDERKRDNETKADIGVASSPKTPQNQCNDLQQVLVDHYKTTCLIVQNPAESNDIGLEYLCVDPTIKVLSQSKGRDGLKHVNRNATSFLCKNIFFNEEYQSRQIYITGEAGSGKSMMCKILVRLWCEAHGLLLSSDSEGSESDSDDEALGTRSLSKGGRRRQERKQRQKERIDRREENREILSHFTFLFYITLRDSLSEYSISEMIQSQILKHHSSVKVLHASDLLSYESCLVIVDGLDEWVCPPGAPVPHFLNPGIPGRDIFNKNNVFLTTTRPWKYDILQLKSSDVDKHVELCELPEKSASQICTKVLRLLNEMHVGSKTKTECFRTLGTKGLGHFKTIPVILIQLVCLWFDNQDLARSQVQLYSDMLDLLLKRSKKNLSMLTINKPASVASESPLPKCIVEHPHCQNHQQLIYCLSRVSFDALFDKSKENSLVFKTWQLDICGVGQESIDMCLKSGILSQSKVLEKCAVGEKKLSFLHKKFQEFLAAIFIDSCDNIQDIVKHITDYCNTLDACLEMSQVWLFVSGIRPDIAKQLLDHLTCVVTVDQTVKHYRQTLYGEGLIGDIQRCITDCVVEGSNYGYNYDYLCLADFFITKATLSHVNPLLLCTKSTEVKSVYIYTEGMDSDQLADVTSQLQHCHSVQKLYMYDHYIPSRIDINTVAQIVNNNIDTLTCLHLDSDITATAELVSDICSIISKCLMALRLYCVRLTHDHIEQILTKLSQSPTVKQLELYVHCTDHDDQCKTARINLSTMTHIQTLNLWNMSVDNLQSVSHFIEDVSLWGIQLPVTTLCEFACRLSKTRRDVTVKLWGVTVTQDITPPVDVATFLRTCQSLKVTHCRYRDWDNAWMIEFTTSSQ